MSDKYDRLESPPPPLFLNHKEKDLVKQINDELIEKVIGQQLIYYPISLEHTNFHPLYGEAINKTFLPPIHIFALIEYEATPSTTTNYGVDRMSNIIIHFHKRRLTEDQQLYVREGDFVAYGDNFYEIINVFEPKEIFGQTQHKMEISAKCKKARSSLFNGM